MFARPSYAYFEHELNKGDIIYLKVYLLGKALDTGASASMYIGISKNNTMANVLTWGSSYIVGTNSEFDTKYDFYSGDYYNTEKQLDSLSSFDYSLVSISSPNFESWDGGSTYGLDKLIDRSTTTYMNTIKGKAINSGSPPTLIFDLGKVYYFDYIYFLKKGPNNYAPKTIIISTSDDNYNFVQQQEITTVINVDNVEINLTKYFKQDMLKCILLKQHHRVLDILLLSRLNLLKKELAML